MFDDQWQRAEDIKLFKTLSPLCDQTDEDITPICSLSNAMD
jgi:hypothetical protein